MTIILKKKEIEQIKQNKIPDELKAKILEDGDEATACNYGTDGEIIYSDCVPVIDDAGNEYEIKICWETTEEWDRSCRAHEIQNFKDSEMDSELEDEMEKLEALGICDATDEANACNWDEPISIEIIK